MNRLSSEADVIYEAAGGCQVTRRVPRRAGRAERRAVRRRRVAGPAWSDVRVGREVPGTACGTQGPRTRARRHQVLVPLAGAVPACGMCQGGLVSRVPGSPHVVPGSSGRRPPLSHSAWL